MKFNDYELNDDGSESEYIASSDLSSASSSPVKEKTSDDDQNEEAEKESEEEDDTLCDSQQSPSSSVAKIDKLWKKDPWSALQKMVGKYSFDFLTLL